jgi:hypothetical protein
MTSTFRANIIKVDEAQNPPLVVARLIVGDNCSPFAGDVIYFRPKDHCCYLWSEELQKDPNHKPLVKYDPVLAPNMEVEVEYENFEKNFAHRIHCIIVLRDNVPMHNEPVIRVSDLLRYTVFSEGDRKRLYEFVPPAEYIKSVGADKIAVEVIKQVPTETLVKELLDRGYFKK